MKKLLVFVAVAILGIGSLSAKSVDVNTAKSLGQKFVLANFESNRSIGDLELVYTVTSDNGQPCVFVFNVGDTGFVIVSATDNVRPILGYSQNGTFDASNPHNGAMFMLYTYKNSISYAMEENIAATPEIAAEWESLRNNGKLNTKNRGKVEPLVKTKWNQDNPYNLFSPHVPANANPQHIANAPGGRCYAGCVATAMGQLMKHWDHPIQGEGSHSYNCVGYGPTYYQYGVQTANFGATTYQWDNMPLRLNESSTQTEIEAVATLLYHCGVSVNMTFDWDGSGAQSSDVPGAMATYFDYDHCVQKQRSSYPLANWIAMLKAEFDLGRPVYYSGYDYSTNPPGGHAFVCDGYDENDLMHFNFGWGGSDDDYYAVDAIDYHTNASAIFNFVPTAVYQNTVQAPTNVTATKTSDVAQEATITWTNPTKTVTNQNLSTLDRIVVTREGIEIYSVDNATPGASMSFVDSNVPCYSTFEYKVFAVKDGVNGAAGVASESFGPTCQWKVVATAQEMQGWKGGCIVAYDGAGRPITTVTMTNNNSTIIPMDLTLGRVSFGWKAGSDVVTLSFKIKDAAGTVVYDFPQNTSDNIPEGFFYTGNNGCGNAAPTDVPGELYAYQEGDNVLLTWDSPAKTDYGVNIYRDGFLCGLSQTNEFVDLLPGQGGHCYQICYLTDGGESPLSNEACANAGEGCEAGKNLWYGYQTSGRPIITWEAPDDEDGLSNYYIYRKVGDEQEYKRVKIVAASKHEYKDNTAVDPELWYYYKVIAYYKDLDECFAAPIKAKYGNEYFVKVYYTVTDVNDAMAGKVTVYPNPVNDNFTVEAEGLQRVMVYNTLGQMVYDQACEGDAMTINLGHVEAGFYMVKVLCNEGETVRKISVIR